jgi:hypothetical protein
MRVIFAVAALIVLASAVQEDINDEDFSEASQAVDVMLQEGKSDSACRKLANGSKLEISNGQKNTQRLLNRMDVGKNCHTAGLSAYNAAKRRESNAKRAADTATRNCNKAKNVRVKVGSKSLSQFKVACSTFLNDRAYTSAKGHMTRTCNDATRKRAAHADSRKATTSALRAHQKAKEQCACRAQKTHKAAVRTTSNFNSASNAKAWTKAHHMICVLDGKAANRCSVPRVPRVTAPRMPSWVARVNTCESHRRERAAKQKERNSKATERKNKHHHRERTSKANERKVKALQTCHGGVWIYQHQDFKGYQRHFHPKSRNCKSNCYPGSYNMHAMQRMGVPNDSASAARVWPGCKLVIYQHSRFNGRSKSFSCRVNKSAKRFPQDTCQYGKKRNWRSNSFTGVVGNDQMSSFKVCNLHGPCP